MQQWTKTTAEIIAKHCKDFTQESYTVKMQAYGGFERYLQFLGGVFAEDLPVPVKTVGAFRKHVEFVAGLMAVWGFDYNNGSVYYHWGCGDGTKPAPDAFYQSGKGKCSSGSIKELCTGSGGKGRTTNCNYGVDTLFRSMGFPVWSCDYDRVIASGAKWVTKKAQLKPGDMVHFWRGSVSKKNWKHIAVVYAVEDGKVWLMDFGRRFIKSKKPLHYMDLKESGNAGGEYGTYIWKAVRLLHLEDDTKKEVPMLNGIDIASHQTGINLVKVPGDFVIIKATEGEGYTNPAMKEQVQSALNGGKLIGFYHYAAGRDPEKEADYFLAKVNGYIGKAVLALDWESGGNISFGKNDVEWCKRFLDRVYQKTGARPLIYMSQGVTNAHDWSSVAKDYGLWVAQYPNNNSTGYRTDAQHGVTGAWSFAAIYQYSSHGRLSGWNSNLDLNIAYMDRAAWSKYAAANVPAPDPQKKTVDLTVTLPEIHLGDRGEAVKLWQLLLDMKGDEIDGKYGTQTQKKTLIWQEKNGKKEDGWIGKGCWTTMLKNKGLLK